MSVRSLFSDCPLICRSIGKSDVPNTSEEQIQHLLTKEEWITNVQDLSAYLNLTHILSQAVMLRFTNSSPENRWNMLEKAAGIDTLNRIREKLSNPGLSGAFNRKVDELKEEHADLIAKKTQINDLLKRLELLKSLEIAKGGIPPEKVANELIGILNKLQVNDFDDFIIDSDKSPELLMQDISHFINQYAQTVSARKNSLLMLQNVPLKYSELMQLLGITKSNIISEKEKFESTKKQGQKIKEELGHLEDDIKLNNEKQIQFLNQKEIADTILDAIFKISYAKTEINTYQSTRVQIENEIAQIQTNLETANVTLTRHLQYEQAIEVNSQHAKSIVDCDKLLQVYLSDKKQLQEKEIRKSAILQHVKKCSDEIEKISFKISDCRSKIETLRLQMNVSNEKQSKIKKGVSDIVSQLTDNDTQCPVCSSHFTKGKLKELALLMVEKDSVELNYLIAQIIDAQSLYDSLEKAKTNSMSSLSTAELELASIQKQQQNVSEIKTALSAFPLLLGIGEDDYAACLSAYKEESKAQLENILHQRSQLIPKSQLEPTIEMLKKQLCKQNDQLKSCIEHLSKLEKDISELTELVKIKTQNLGIVVDQITDFRNLLNEQINLIISVLHETQLKRDSLKSDLAKIESDSLLFANNIVVFEKQADDISTQIENLSTNWLKTIQQNAISQSTYEVQMSLLEEQIASVEIVKMQIHDLISAIEAWNYSNEIAKINETLNLIHAEFKLAPDCKIIEHCNNLIELKQNEISVAQKALKHRNALKEQIDEALENYLDHVVSPLNIINSAFVKALSSFPIDISLEPEKSRIKQQLDIKLKFFKENLVAKDYLSEGQIASLSVSLQLSMNTAYPWSKWKALLLDDPLQYNDLIHTTAFIEVLRSLILREGYQIIMSTHDLQMAEYIRRKIEAADIQFKQFQFTGLENNAAIIRE